MIAYHKMVHNNDRIEVGAWEPEYPDPSDPQPTCRRTVTMWQSFDAPYIVRKAAGIYKTAAIYLSAGTKCENLAVGWEECTLSSVCHLSELHFRELIGAFPIYCGQPCSAYEKLLIFAVLPLYLTH
jgi:hypothetical protein